MKKYSEFISFPIYLWASKEVDVEVPVEEAEEKEEKETDDAETEEEDASGKFTNPKIYFEKRVIVISLICNLAMLIFNAEHVLQFAYPLDGT